MATTRQRIRIRRDTQANWTTQNPTLLAGEIGYESDTKRAKVGDGTNAWAALEYAHWNSHPTLDLLGLRLDAAESLTTGQLAWNADQGTIDIGKLNGVVGHLGTELQLICRNNSGASIPIGRAVMFTGSLGNSGRITIAPMVADGSVPPYAFFGVTAEAISNGTDGYVTAFGKIRKVDTRDWPDGTVLWCHPTIPGTFTSTEPSAPNLKLPVAAVVNSATNGILLVRWDTGRRLADLHDVDANGSKSDGDVLTYVAANQRWEAAPVTGSSMATLPDVDTTNKVDKSVLVYNAALGKWVGDATNTTLTITDGGNF